MACCDDDEEEAAPLLEPFVIQLSSHGVLAAGSLLLLVYSAVQMSRLWLAGSKLSNRKRVFLHLMLLLSVRFVWLSLAALGGSTAFPPSFLDAAAALFSPLSASSPALLVDPFDSPSSSIFPSLPWTSGWLQPLLTALVMRFLYVYPLTLVFQASCWLLLNWFELFQKEKLRKKLPRLVRSWADPDSRPPPAASPKTERLAAHQRQRQLARLSKRLVLVVNAAAFAAGCAWCLLSLPLFAAVTPLLDRLRAAALLPVPSLLEALLALLCLLCLLVMCHACFVRLADVVVAVRSGHSSKLKRHNLLTVGLSLSALLYYLAIVLFYAVTAAAAADNNDATIIVAARSHLIVRLLELLHCALVLRLLASPSLSLKAPFPSDTNAITQDWLTSVLKENGHLGRGISVAAFWSEQLKGGCHYRVSRVNLLYSKSRTSAPKTVVVKLLYWDRPIVERIYLHLKWLLDVDDDLDVTYLKSYQMEHRFYKQQVYASECGIRVPHVYYNLEDVFNTRFGMVCQDLSALDDGQPLGFNLSDCQLLLQNLAQFHAAHWAYNSNDHDHDHDHDDQNDSPSRADTSTGSSSSSEKFHGWAEAGYWTGDKREASKNKVATAWEDCCSNFAELQLRADYPQLGRQLLERLAFVRSEFVAASSPAFRTLCHGDFKISNLFVGNLASALLRMEHTAAAQYYARDGAASESVSDVDTDGGGGADAVDDLDARHVYAIDWQWFGLGSCCIDVASFLVTSPLAGVLPQLDQLALVYYQALMQHLPEHLAAAYSFATYRHHFNVAFVDFCTYCITAKWSKMTPEDIADNARKTHDGLHLRSVPHMLFIIERTARILQEWDAVYPLVD